MEKNRKTPIIIVILILFLVVAILGISYALWNLTITQEGTSIVVTDCFKINFTDKNPITLEKAYPMEDSEGMELTPYTFTLENVCDARASFQINLETIKQGSNVKAFPNKYIKTNLSENETTLITTKLDKETNTSLETSPTLENVIDAYKLYTGTLKSKETKIFNVRLWIDEATPAIDEVMNASFQGKITIIASYKETKLATDYITKLASTSEELVYDETADNNLRYIGANPDNYVWFGDTYQTDIYDINSGSYGYYGLNLTSQEECETFKTTNGITSTYTCEKAHSSGDKILWRIIGVMNNIDNGSGKKETRIKLIRNETIGPWSWDSSESIVNSGYGVNEWSVSKMKTVLNDYFYNGLSVQTCIVAQNNKSIFCDFSLIGMPDDMKSIVSDVIWNTGSNGNVATYNAIKSSKFYELERSNNTGKICSSGTYCNDAITRTVSWTGKVGLMTPSDYGYATSGGDTINRNTCLNTYLYNWSNLSDCYNNDWLYSGSYQWTMIPVAYSGVASNVFLVNSSKGYVYNHAPSYGLDQSSAAWVRPTVFLNADVSIKEGKGTQEQPFVFE